MKRFAHLLIIVSAGLVLASGLALANGPAGQWLQPAGMLSADIAPSPNDGKVDLLDFSLLAEDWRQSSAP